MQMTGGTWRCGILKEKGGGGRYNGGNVTDVRDELCNECLFVSLDVWVLAVNVSNAYR